MYNYLPGTTIETDLKKNDAGMIMDNIFSAGGLVLSQVSSLSGVEPYTVQNWVKRKFLSPPVSKKYNRKQFCRIITINMLKDCLPINEVTRLLSYINGHLDDERDDMIEDDKLYLMLVSVITSIDTFSEAEAKKSIENLLSGFKEKFAGAKERLSKALLVMTYAYYSTLYSRTASIYMSSFDQ